MPCGCKKGSGVRFTGAGLRRKRGGIAFSGAGIRRKRGGTSFSGAGFKKRKKGRRRKRRRGGGLTEALFNPTAAAARLLVGAVAGRSKMGSRMLQNARRFAVKRGGGGRILSGAVWHGYGSGVNLHGAGVRGKRVLARRGTGKRLI